MKDKANKGYWQRLAKIYAPLMESDKKFYNAICGYIRDSKEIIYAFLTIFLYLLKCPQSLIL